MLRRQGEQMPIKKSFTVVDQHGKRRTLQLIVDGTIAVPTLADPHATLEGPGRFQLPDGQSVNRLEKGKYQTVHTREILTSDDADAP